MDNEPSSKGKLSSLFSSGKKSENEQTASVKGDGNKIIQINVGDNSNVFIGSQKYDSEKNIVSEISTTELLPSSITADDSKQNSKDAALESQIKNYRKIADEGNKTQAIKFLEELFEDNPNCSDFYKFKIKFNIGIIYNSCGNLPNSIEALTEAHRYQPDNRKATTGLALAHLIKGDATEALEQAKELFEQEQDPFTAVVLIYSAIQSNQNIKIENFDPSLKENSEVIHALLEYLHQFEPEKYSEELKKAAQKFPDDLNITSTKAREVLADAQRNQGFLLGENVPEDYEDNLQESADILYHFADNKISEQPINDLLFISAINNAALALRLSGQIPKAAALLDRAFDVRRELSEQFIELRAVCYLNEDRAKDALRIIGEKPPTPELSLMAAEILAELGEYSQALEKISALSSLVLTDELEERALTTKVKIGISSKQQEIADEALEDLRGNLSNTHLLAKLESAYE